MEMLQHRRKAVTYGKSRKRLQLESIFDDEDIRRTHIRLSTLPGQVSSQPSVTTKRIPDGIEVKGHQSILLHGQHSRLASPSNTNQSQVSSDSSNSQFSLPNGSTNFSMLDILDSDEEACAQQLQPVEFKRRKVTSLKKRVTASQQHSYKKTRSTAIGKRDSGMQK